MENRFRLNCCSLKSFFPHTLFPEAPFRKKWHLHITLMWSETVMKNERRLSAQASYFLESCDEVFAQSTWEEGTMWPISPPSGELWKVQLSLHCSCCHSKLTTPANTRLTHSKDMDQHPSPLRTSWNLKNWADWSDWVTFSRYDSTEFSSLYQSPHLRHTSIFKWEYGSFFDVL